MSRAGIGVNPMWERYFSIRWVDLTGKSRGAGYGEVPELPKKHRLVVAFDQSSRQTGIAIMTESGKRFMLIDVENRGGKIPLADYERMLEFSLMHMFEGRQVSKVSVEKPLKGKSKYSYSVLERLRGFMGTLMYRVEGFRGAEIGEVYPQSWKSKYLAGPEYKGRFSRDKVKDAVREETAKRYEWCRGYVYGAGAPPDSCDAMGILDGYVELNYKNGMKIVNSTMGVTYNHAFSYIVEVLSVEDLKRSIRDTGRYNEIIFVRGLEVVRYNEEMSLEDNVRRVTSNTNRVVALPVLSEQESMVLRWETGRERQPGELYVIMCWRDNTSERLGEVVPLWEEQGYWNPKIG